MSYAPIALFVYKRPVHTRLTIEKLAKNNEFSKSVIYVFSDGPKNESDKHDVEAVRDVVRAFNFENLILVESASNRGLAKSVVAGVNNILSKHEKIIVLEDDLIVSPFFLKYMNAALNFYAAETRVMQISAYMYPIVIDDICDAFFLPFVSTWGWATWRRSWEKMDLDMSAYEKLSQNKSMRNSFDLEGAYQYFRMLKKQHDGLIDSWGILWNSSVFMNNGLVLYPRVSLVSNIGFDGSGTHCTVGVGDNLTVNDNFKPKYYPECYKVHEDSYRLVKYYLRKNNRIVMKFYKFVQLRLQRIMRSS